MVLWYKMNKDFAPSLKLPQVGVWSVVMRLMPNLSVRACLAIVKGWGTVTSLLEENGTVKGVLYKTKNSEELRAYAPLTIVCDGGFSNLRRSLCIPKVDVPSCFVGLVLQNCQLPYPNHGYVILADPSPLAQRSAVWLMYLGKEYLYS
ncbi:Aromatic-ring hydroxylase-like protein [Cinnamomum micranthum f. kanehirae]|uniref:Squalene monooxygenase n=1 Tax=Cinnamomum micranthum f. kanehirae TaxID=337451 RepID=A0A443NHG0_9MAGN|nr:Aromatic-ring hydroxylase-like protein [Cinnamomum micranthum f. kanehirae]